MIDPFGRAITYLRVSVTDRCDLRCVYCMAEDMHFLPKAQLLTLEFSRSDESEADLVGMELAARAGFDPRAGITLWQKMAAASQVAPPQWLSTHPAGSTRIADIEANLPKVMPLYLRAKK